MDGATVRWFKFHISLISFAQAITSLPSVPSGFFCSSFCMKSKRDSKKYLVSSYVLDKHCRLEFMQQVLPRLFRPTTPLLLFSERFYTLTLLSSSSAWAEHAGRWKFSSFLRQASLQQRTRLQGHSTVRMFLWLHHSQEPTKARPEFLYLYAKLVPLLTSIMMISQTNSWSFRVREVPMKGSRQIPGNSTPEFSSTLPSSKNCQQTQLIFEIYVYELHQTYLMQHFLYYLFPLNCQGPLANPPRQST